MFLNQHIVDLIKYSFKYTLLLCFNIQSILKAQGRNPFNIVDEESIEMPFVMYNGQNESVIKDKDPI